MGHVFVDLDNCHVVKFGAKLLVIEYILEMEKLVAVVKVLNICALPLSMILTGIYI